MVTAEKEMPNAKPISFAESFAFAESIAVSEPFATAVFRRYRSAEWQIRRRH